MHGHVRLKSIVHHVFYDIHNSGRNKTLVTSPLENKDHVQNCLYAVSYIELRLINLIVLLASLLSAISSTTVLAIFLFRTLRRISMWSLMHSILLFTCRCYIGYRRWSPSNCVTFLLLLKNWQATIMPSVVDLATFSALIPRWTVQEVCLRCNWNHTREIMRAQNL